MKRSIALVLGSLLIGCGGDHPGGVEGDAFKQNPSGGTPIDPCASAGPGCPCPSIGATSVCKVYRLSGKYISCSTGTTTCGADNKWGRCEGAAVEWTDDAGARD